MQSTPYRVLAGALSAIASAQAPDVEPASVLPAERDGAEVEPASEAARSFGLSGDWGGLRRRLEEDGVALEASLIYDLHQIASGGLERGSVGHSLFDVTATFDLAQLVGLDGGVLVANAYVISGRNPSDLVGDYQSFSDISGDHTAQLGQLYYEQHLFGDALRVKLGKADANVDFGAPDSAGDVIHSGAAYSPTIFVFPTYEDPATCVAAFWRPNERWSLSGGVYDGATQAGEPTGGRGPSTFFGSPSDLFLIGEASHLWTAGADELAGRFTLGVWRHTGDFERFDGGTEEGTSGWYALADQELARIGAGEAPATIAGFVQWGAADEAVADADRHLGLGVACKGLGGRPEDALGLCVSRVRFSDLAGTSADAETAFELSYTWKARPWLVVKPDVQVITDPGGDASLDDALVFTLRMQVDF